MIHYHLVFLPPTQLVSHPVLPLYCLPFTIRDISLSLSLSISQSRSASSSVCLPFFFLSSSFFLLLLLFSTSSCRPFFFFLFLSLLQLDLDRPRSFSVQGHHARFVERVAGVISWGIQFCQPRPGTSYLLLTPSVARAEIEIETLQRLSCIFLPERKKGDSGT